MYKKIILSLLINSFIFSQTIFFSEYAEGSSNNKYLEIYNNTDQIIDLSQYAFPNSNNGADVEGIFDYWNIFDGLDLLLVSNDGSDYYVPSFNVDQIGELDSSEGFNVFLNGGDSQSLTVEGLPVDSSQEILLEAYKMNLLPYLLQDCMSTDVVFAGYEDDLLVVKSDDSDYFVPAFGVQTLSEMCPGEAYAVFLNGGDDVEFTYPMGTALSSGHADYFVEDYTSRTRTNDVPLTGESHLILLSQIDGKVEMGDELRAYANGMLVGSINIVEEHLNGTHPIDLIATGSVDMSLYGGPVLPGYVKGDIIELAYYTNGMEYKVDSHLTDDQYGNAMELSTGTITLLSDGVNPTEFGIANNYPNPFNPSTTIEYNVENSGHVSLKIFDIMGRSVRTLVNEYKESGRSDYKVVWDGKNDHGQQVSAGLYLYTLSSNGLTDHAKMVLMK